jgi:hypothetical protein
MKLADTVPLQTSNGLGMNGEQTAEFPCTCKVISAHHLQKNSHDYKTYELHDLFVVQAKNKLKHPTSMCYPNIIITPQIIKCSIGPMHIWKTKQLKWIRDIRLSQNNHAWVPARTSTS